MLSVVLVVQVIVTVFMIAIIMIQKSEGGGLGIGGSGGGMGDFLGAKGTANLLTRATTVLAATFMVLSIVLAIMFSKINGGGESIVDIIAEQDKVVAEEVIQEEPILEEAVEKIVEEVDSEETTTE